MPNKRKSNADERSQLWVSIPAGERLLIKALATERQQNTTQMIVELALEGAKKFVATRSPEDMDNWLKLIAKIEKDRSYEKKKWKHVKHDDETRAYFREMRRKYYYRDKLKAIEDELKDYVEAMDES